MAITPARYTVTTTVTAVQLSAANVADVVAWLVGQGVRAYAAPRASALVFAGDARGGLTTATPGDWLTMSAQGPAKVSAAAFAAGYVTAAK